MAVWTNGSARRKSAFWIWIGGLMSPRSRHAQRPVEKMPDALCQDVTAAEEPLPRPKDDLWARIAAARLPHP